MSAIAVVVSIVLALVCTIRIPHLIASDIWILQHGSKWLRDVKSLTDDKRADPEEISKKYDEHLGYNAVLFLGIKSYRLRRWYVEAADRREKKRKLLLATVRAGWRYFTFPIGVMAIVTIISLVDLPAVAEVLLTYCGFAVAIGFIVIAAESVLAAQHLASWANWYHRWPKGASVEARPSAETSVFIGSVILSWVSTGLLLTSTQRFYGVFEKFPDGFGAQLLAGLAAALPIGGAVVTVFVADASSFGYVVLALVVLVSFSWVQWASRIVVDLMKAPKPPTSP